MNKKGFTIIELIATIALLSIIAAISFISISSVLEQNKVNNCESLKMNITSASKEYISDNRYTYTDKNDKEVTLFRLVNNKYLTKTIVDPFSNKDIDTNKIKIIVTLNDDYTANTVTIKVNGTNLNCNNKEIFKSVLK